MMRLSSELTTTSCSWQLVSMRHRVGGRPGRMLQHRRRNLIGHGGGDADERRGGIAFPAGAGLRRWDFTYNSDNTTFYYPPVFRWR